MAALVTQLWPDASQDPSDLFSLLRLANKPHSGPWTSTLQDCELPVALERVFHRQISCQLDAHSAGATARIAVIVQTGCEFLSGGRRDATADEREGCYGRATVALTRAIEHTSIVSPLDMAGMIGMAQTLGVYHYRYTERPIHPVPWPYSPPHRQNCYNGMGISGTFYFPR